MSNSPSPSLISVANAAVILGVSKPTVVRLLDRGELNGARVGRRRLVLMASIQKLLAGAVSK